MARKKVWYEIEITNELEETKEVVAKVRSEGLANIVYGQLLDVYKHNKDIKVRVK